MFAKWDGHSYAFVVSICDHETPALTIHSPLGRGDRSLGFGLGPWVRHDLALEDRVSGSDVVRSGSRWIEAFFAAVLHPDCALRAYDEARRSLP